MKVNWTHYDKWGFHVHWYERTGEPGGGWYWHVYHRQYGARWGYATSQRDCHHKANWAIGDMRNGYEA